MPVVTVVGNGHDDTSSNPERDCISHSTNPIYQTFRSGRIWHKVNDFKRSLTGLNSESSFSYTSCFIKAEEPSLPYYLPIAGGRIIGFIPFPRVLVLCEMQSVSSRIWTRVAVSISYDDNHYTMGTSHNTNTLGKGMDPVILPPAMGK